MRAVDTTERGSLEDLIDRTSLSELIDAISQICYEKAEHIRSNWQDDRTARSWSAVATKLGNLSGSLKI